jgi:hypothetical protein
LHGSHACRLPRTDRSCNAEYAGGFNEKAYIGVDGEAGLVHTPVGPAANVDDVRIGSGLVYRAPGQAKFDSAQTRDPHHEHAREEAQTWVRPMNAPVSTLRWIEDSRHHLGTGK